MPGRRTLECASKTLDDVGLGRSTGRSFLGRVRLGGECRARWGNIWSFFVGLDAENQVARRQDETLQHGDRGPWLLCRENNMFSQYPAHHHGEAENGGGWRCLATSAKRKGEAGRHPHHHHKFHSGERHTITPRHAENSSFMYRVSESLPTPSCHPSDISRPSILPAFQNPVKLSSSIHSHGPWSSITFSSSKSRIIGPVPPFTLPSPPSIGLSNLSSPSRYPPSPPP